MAKKKTNVTGTTNSVGTVGGSTNVGAKTNNAAADNGRLVKGVRTNVIGKNGVGLPMGRRSTRTQ